VSEAVAAGAQVGAGGEPIDGAGSFYPPTVLVGVDDRMAIMRDETLGRLPR
jgi:acyl-CoA reductase-like NAD-dependent aldehyde dehydrogenase